MKIKGTEPRPGFEAPNIEKICDQVREWTKWGVGNAHTKDDNEEEVHVSNIVKLEPQIFRNETESGVFRSPDFVPRILGLDVPFLGSCFRRQGNVEVDCSWPQSFGFLLLAHWTFLRDLAVVVRA